MASSSIADATQAEVLTAYSKANALVKALQPYVQGSANGPKGTLVQLTAAEVDALLLATSAACLAVNPS